MIVSSSGVRGLTGRWRSIIELDHQAAPRELAASTPGPAARKRPRVWIVEDQTGIVAMAIARGAVDPVAVAEVLRQAVDAHMPVIASAIEAAGRAGSRHRSRRRKAPKEPARPPSHAGRSARN